MGILKALGGKLREAASWLALIGLVLYPLRDTIGFWGRYLDPKYSAGALGPLMWIGGTALFVALLLALMVFVQGARQPASQ